MLVCIGVAEAISSSFDAMRWITKKENVALSKRILCLVWDIPLLLTTNLEKIADLEMLHPL